MMFWIYLSIGMFILSLNLFVIAFKKRKPKPRYVCQRCGYEEYERLGVKKVFYIFLTIIILVCVIFTSAIGSLSLYNLISTEVFDSESFYSLGGLWSEPLNIMDGYEYVVHPELKEIALNLTKGCNTDYCKTKSIYNYLKINFRYEHGDNLNPLEIWEDKSGDCDEMSYLYNSLLESIGVESDMQCKINSEEGHCYSIVQLKDMRILVDIAKYRWIEYERQNFRKD